MGMIWNWIAQWIGTVALTLIGTLYAWSPRALRIRIGRGLGWILKLFKVRMSVVADNLERAFPGVSQQAKRTELLKEAYTHLGHLTLEIMTLFGPFRRFVSQNSELRGVENWRQAKLEGKGVIVLSSHLGNWEVMAAQGAMAGGIDVMLVTKLLKPLWIHRAIEKGRASCGVQATYEPRTFKDVLKHLRGNGTVGFVLDQYAGPPVGVRVPFFGVPVGTSPAVATVVKRTGAVVLPVVSYRDAQGHFVIEIEPAIPWIEASQASEGNAEEELALNTSRYVARLEEHIRKYPGQWLWTHRRFKGNLAPLEPGEWKRPRVRK